MTCSVMSVHNDSITIVMSMPELSADDVYRPQPLEAMGLPSGRILFLFECCFTFKETVRTVRDGEPRTATSTFTQLLSSVFQQFSVALRRQRTYGLLGTGS